MSEEKRKSSNKDDAIIKSKSVFLPEDALQHEGKPPEYNLGNEIGKAKKRRDYFYYLVPLVFIVFIVLIAYGITNYLITKNRKVDVNISEFESFNLSELLKSAKQDKRNLDSAKVNVSELEFQRDSMLKSVRDQAKAEREEIKEAGLTPEEEEKRLKAISASSAKKIERYKQEFNEKIAEKEEEIKALEKKVSSQQKLLAKSNVSLEEESNTDNEQKLADIQLEKQKQEYEDRIAGLKKNYERRIASTRNFYLKKSRAAVEKYNPLFEEDPIASILAQEEVPLENSYAMTYRSVLKRENIMDKTEYETLIQNIKDRDTLMDAMLKVPYTNSVPSTLKHIDSFDKSIQSKYQNMWVGLSIGVLKRDQAINSYRYALEHYTSIMQEHLKGFSGYILDARKSEAVVLFLKFPKSVKDGDKVYVVNDEKEYLATLELHPFSELTLAEMTEGNISDVSPFSRIMKNDPRK